MVLIGISVLLVGCGEYINSYPSSYQEQVQVKDSLGRTVILPRVITRAVVVNRYNMEVVKSLGADSAVVGVDYGIYQDRVAYGDLFNSNNVIAKSQNELNYEKIIELAPQVLIITSNGAWEDAVKKLSPFGIQVVVMDAYYTKQFEQTYRLAGVVFHKEQEAENFISYFQDKLTYVRNQLRGVPKKKVYFEYRRAGVTTIPGDYFFDMIEYAHGENIFKDAKATVIDIEEVMERNPDAIIKLGEVGADPSYIPPTKELFEKRKQALITRPGWEEIEAVQKDKILLMSQYVHGAASKILGSLYIAKFLYPEYLPDLHPEEVYYIWVTKYQRLPYMPGHTYPVFTLNE